MKQVDDMEKLKMSKQITLVTLLTVMSCVAGAQQAPSIQKQWLEFQKNPQLFMDATPLKHDSQGRLVPPGQNSHFSSADVNSRAFIDKKENFRLGKVGAISSPICNERGICLDQIQPGRSAALFRVEDWLDAKEMRSKGVKVIKSLADMESKGLLASNLAETPWSDTYWPIAQGILGVRYASTQFMPLGFDWKARYDLTMSQSANLKSVFDRSNADEIDSLSPSEKYDLLLGDLSGQTPGVYDNGYLTPSMWAEGQKYYSESGKVEDWMGICHGWSPAASMEPRPKHVITTKASDGRRDIKFYPSDLKGLASYLWAKTQYPTSFLGGRCGSKNPKKDPSSGRILDEACFDTNPGNWHVAVVNQIGQVKRSFVIDATYDYEVWNQPVYSYKYRYFNPQTGAEVATLKEATVAVADFTRDKFKKFRAPETTSIVGIQMDLTYVVENQPTHEETNSASADLTQTVSYMYDLELNAKDQIIGGEWYQNQHPDFIWMPKASARALSYGDSQIENGANWTAGQEIPKFWRDIAIQTASRYGQPLAAIVEPLLSQANQ